MSGNEAAGTGQPTTVEFDEPEGAHAPPARVAVSDMHRAERLVRFVAVGIVGFVANTAVLAVLVGQGLPSVVASAIATEAAILLNYVNHEFFTFQTRNLSLRRTLSFNAAATVGLVITAVAFGLVTRAVPDVPLVLRNLAAVGCGTLSNFLLSSKFVWGRHVR